MATQLEIVNKVLLRLREDQVSASTDNEYSQLVAEFVADIHREVVEARQWQSNKHELVFDTVVGQTEYVVSKDITDSGDARDANARFPTTLSVVRLDSNGNAQAFQYDDDSDETGEALILVPYADLYRFYRQDSTHSIENVTYFAVSNDGVDLKVHFGYTPDTVKKVIIQFDTEDAELESDGSTDNVVVLVPHRPVYLGALFMGLNERGEEIGEPGNIAQGRYYNALNAAMEVDMAHDEYTDKYDWRRD